MDGAAAPPDGVREQAQRAYRRLQDGGYRPSPLKFDERRGEWVMWINAGDRMMRLADAAGLKGWSARKWTALLVWSPDDGDGARRALVFHNGRRERRVEDALLAFAAGT